jgi:hypothetical protein
MNITIDALTSNIQLALAPVFLLTAVATLVGAISTRLARTVDRMRFVQNALYGNQALSDKLRMHYEIELREFKMRGRLCTVAIFFNVLSGVLISLNGTRAIFLSDWLGSTAADWVCCCYLCIGFNFLYDFPADCASGGGACLSLGELGYATLMRHSILFYL